VTGGRDGGRDTYQRRVENESDSSLIRQSRRTNLIYASSPKFATVTNGVAIRKRSARRGGEFVCKKGSELPIEDEETRRCAFASRELEGIER
jgi:phage FluMu gp28-like protein